MRFFVCLRSQMPSRTPLFAAHENPSRTEKGLCRQPVRDRRGFADCDANDLSERADKLSAMKIPYHLQFAAGLCAPPTSAPSRHLRRRRPASAPQTGICARKPASTNRSDLSCLGNRSRLSARRRPLRFRTEVLASAI
jgi:hypothetical protein